MRTPNLSPISFVLGSGLAVVYSLLLTIAIRGVFVWALVLNVLAFVFLLAYFWGCWRSAQVAQPRPKKSHFVEPIDLTGKSTSAEQYLEPIFSLTAEDDEFVSGTSARFSTRSGQNRSRRQGLNVIPNRQKLIYKNSAKQRLAERKLKDDVT